MRVALHQVVGVVGEAPQRLPCLLGAGVVVEAALLSLLAELEAVGEVVVVVQVLT